MKIADTQSSDGDGDVCNSGGNSADQANSG